MVPQEGELVVEGAVDAPARLSASDLARLPQQVPDVSALVPGREGTGVWLRAVVAAASPRHDEARFITLGSAGAGFSLSLPLAPLLERALVVYGLGGAPLPAAKGGPLRLLIAAADRCGGHPGAEIDGCANVKGLAFLRLTREREPEVGHHHG